MSTSNKKKRSSTARTLLWVVLALGGCAVWVLMLNGPDAPRAWRSLLSNFLFFSSLAGGLVVWPAVVESCNGRWHLGIDRLATAGIAFALPSLLALIVLWIGSPAWTPWYHATYHQGPWLENALVFARDLAALLLFWGVATWYLLGRRNGKVRVSGVILVLVYCLVFSLLGFDLVMALDPHWHSNLAGGYFFISGLYIAITCWGLLAARHPESGADQRQDIGKLMVAFSLMTTYLMFAHLLLIWYENLPPEIRFLIPRMHNSAWRGVSYFLVALVYFGPLVLLLTIRSKRNRWSLGIISLAVLAGLWIERWWLVAPTFDPLVRLGITELSLAAGSIGLLGLGMDIFHRCQPERILPEEKRP